MLGDAKKNIISMMGITAGVGKSFVSINFASLLANIDKRVLLIDGDIRRGDLHKYLSLPQVPGLNELINNQVNFIDAIQKTSMNHLSFISCGKYPEYPSELLMKNNFEVIMKKLSTEFDYVVIDTAPILAATDSTIVGKLTDVNFLVVAADRHHPEEVILAIKQLENSGIKVHGTLFNNLSEKTVTYGNYRYQYYSYHSEPSVS